MTAQQLKNAILQQAIQGRLVPQDPADEPASVLLDRIRHEKEQLVKQGKLKKKDLTETPISPDEIPFDIPHSWEWVRLSSLSSAIHYGYTASAASDGNSKLLRITDIQDDKVDWKSVPYCTTKEKDLETYQLKNRDILIARTGGTIGKTYIVRQLVDVAVFASYLIRVIPLKEVNEEFLKMFMMTPCYWKQLIDASSGTGQPNVNGQSLSNLIIPIPPKEEQMRILLKWEELLPKVEEYGKAQEALDKLNAELPERLKKSILQQAIQGRLVPQDPADEPASVLLDRIRHEKEQLVKQGKLKKKDLTETPITPDEIPFDIPDSWEWCRISTLFQHSAGKQLKASDTEGNLHQYITTSNLYWDRFELQNLKSMYYKDSEIERCTARKGDLLVCEGGDVGRSAIWSYDYDICLQNHVHRLRPYYEGYTRFVYYIMWLYKNIGIIGGKGIGIKGFSASVLNDICIPLPPLAEQQRIVAKIEQLLTEIDKLKA